MSRITVVLDAPSASLADALAEFADPFVFRPAAGFLSLPADAAEELRTKLATQEIKQPVVLVGTSFGGFTMLTYAHWFVNTVAGIVLVDASHPRQSEIALAALAEVPATPAVETFKNYLRGFGPVWEESCREIQRIGLPRDVPLIVLAAGSPDMPAELNAPVRKRLTENWHLLQREHAARTAHGELRIVAECGHDLPKFAPNQVIRAIRDILQRAK